MENELTKQWSIVWLFWDIFHNHESKDREGEESGHAQWQPLASVRWKYEAHRRQHTQQVTRQLERQAPHLRTQSGNQIQKRNVTQFRTFRFGIVEVSMCWSSKSQCVWQKAEPVWTLFYLWHVFTRAGIEAFSDHNGWTKKSCKQHTIRLMM